MALGDAAAGDGDPTLQAQDNKSLYLCFQTSRDGSPYSAEYEVHGIKLSGLICDRCSSGRSSSCQRNCSSFASLSELKLESPWKSIAAYAFSGFCVYGSSIVLAGGTSTALDTVTLNRVVRDILTLEIGDREESARPRFARFRVGKARPIMVEVGDKLYALPGGMFRGMHPMDLHDCFEVYDPKIARWSLLPPPPFLSIDLWGINGLPTGFCVAVVGTSILVSWGRSFSFNTCTLEWAELRIPSSDFGAPRSYLDEGLFHSHVPGGHDDASESENISCSDAIGDNPFVSCGENLVIDRFMLAYDYAQPWTVSVFRIFGEHSELNFRLLQKLKLDIFPSSFCPQRHQLIHLGGHIVCLVLSFPCYPCEPGSQSLMAAAIIFEFNEKLPADPCSTDSLDYKVLASHLFQSNIKNYQNKLSAIALLGAFVLRDTNHGGT